MKDNLRVTSQRGAFLLPLLQWKSMSIAKPVCVFVALGILHSMRMRHIVIRDLPSSTKYFYII
jgi:hypothetical protein